MPEKREKPTNMLTAQQRQQTPTLHNSTHDVTILKSLLDQGVEVDARDDLVCTSLHWSCAQNQTDAAEFLLQNGIYTASPK